jgi:hypothetical protein
MQEALARCAHRNGLLMSAQDLAVHLREVVGAPGTWREPERPATMGTGTEVFSATEGTEQIALSDLEDSDAALVQQQGLSRRDQSGLFDLGRIKHLELTSLINAALADHAGSRPLVDLDDLAPPPPPVDRRLESPPPLGDERRIERRLEETPPPLESPLPAAPALPTPRPLAATPPAAPRAPARPRGRVEDRRRVTYIVGGGVIIAIAAMIAAVIALSGPKLRARPNDAPAAAPAAGDGGRSDPDAGP